MNVTGTPTSSEPLTSVTVAVIVCAVAAVYAPAVDDALISEYVTPVAAVSSDVGVSS